MGIIKRGILGGVANKIGNVVGSSWKGIATLRSLPLSVANPNTLAQRTNRNSFSIMSKLGSQVLATICQPLWNRDAKQMSGFNAYVMYNKRAYDAGPASWLADPIMSKGNLSASFVDASLTADNETINTTFVTSLQNPQDASDDVAYIQLIHQNNSDPDKPIFEAKGYVTNATRAAGHFEMPNPFEVSSGDKIAISLSFKSADGREVANSVTRVIYIAH